MASSSKPASSSKQRCDSKISSHKALPGSYLVHKAKIVVNHVGISLGFSDDVLRTCPRAVTTHPRQYSSFCWFVFSAYLLNAVRRLFLSFFVSSCKHSAHCVG
jgi:hypothetical protein